MPAPVAEKTQLTTLVAVSQALASTLHLEGALHRVLELVEIVPKPEGARGVTVLPHR